MSFNDDVGEDGESWQVMKSPRGKSSKKPNATSSAVDITTEWSLFNKNVNQNTSSELRKKCSFGTECRSSSFSKDTVKFENSRTSDEMSKHGSKPVSDGLQAQFYMSMEPIDHKAQSSNVLGTYQDCSFANVSTPFSSDATGCRSIIHAPKCHQEVAGLTSTKSGALMGYNVTSEQDKIPLTLTKLAKKNKKKKNSGSSKLTPKDTRVCIISSSQLEKWSQSNSEKSTLLKKNCLPTDTDFPDLSAVLKGLSKSNVTRQNLSETSEDDGIKDSRYKKSRSKEMCHHQQPNSKDPIYVKIFDIIKKPSAACLRASRTHSRREERWRLGGNILDSSNPIRKRGKHREIPAKKKLSKLKLIICHERQKKQEKKERDLKLLNENSSVVGDTLNDVPSVESICAKLLPLKIESSSSTDSKEDAFTEKLEDENKTRCLEGGLMCDEVKISPKTHFDVENTPKLLNPGPSQVPSCMCGVSPSAFHSRKFREYCDNIRSKELDDAVTNLLKEIYRFQDRFHKKDPVLALAKRRFVLGIREVKKYLMLQKLKAIIIAPDLEPIQASGGLDETVKQIREEGKFQQIPVIFAGGRRQLGFALMKKVPISIVGIINPEGAEELYQSMLEKWRAATAKYQQAVQELSSSSM